MVTLLLTCLTPRFAVQASDRRLTLINGDVAEDAANKATLLCKTATFAYTGLARSSPLERTDELLVRCIGKQTRPPGHFNALLDGLAKEAAQKIRGVRLDVPQSQRRAVQRTSFVGTGFVEMRDPRPAGVPPSADGLHPFVAVVSNAQEGLTEQWRDEADREFTVYLAWLAERQPFLLHAAGQPFAGEARAVLERSIRTVLPRIDHAESLARLLARAIREVAKDNRKVGPNVMCTMVRRDKVRSQLVSFRGGMVPLVDALREEASYFRWPRDGPSVDDPAQYIYSPGERSATLYYGPNYTCGGMFITGARFGPAPLPPAPEPTWKP